MTRAEKIHKLANAIKRYRGSYHPETKAWIRTPQPTKGGRSVRLWLFRLGIPVEDGMKAIDAFNHVGQLHQWLATL